MVAFADLANDDTIRFKANGEWLEFQLIEKTELSIVGGGTQVRFSMNRPLSITESMLLQDTLPGKKPTIWFALGVFQQPQEVGPLGDQLTFKNWRAPFPLRKGSQRQLRFKGSVFAQQLYDMPSNETMLAERWTPKHGMASNDYFRLFKLNEADIQRQ